jgi:hypothetical protein
MKSVIILFISLALSLSLRAQSPSKFYQITAMLGDSLVQPGKPIVVTKGDTLHIEVTASPEFGGEVRASTLQYVSQRNIGAGAEVIKFNIPGPPATCMATVPMHFSSGEKFTIVLDGFYRIENGERKRFSVPLAERSFPIHAR